MIYRFHDCEIDTDLYILRKSGRLLQLEPKVFDMLHYLVQHRERVVTKQELLARLWPNQHISEATLSHALMNARKATGDSGQHQRVIQTIRARGYRFVAELEEIHPSSSATPQPSQPTVTPIEDTPPDITGSVLPERSTTGERKSVTILSCALSDIASLMEAHSPDGVHQLLQRFFVLAETAIQHYGGTITHFLDDGFRALFGAPVAYEDHARRAVLAALALHQDMATENALSGTWGDIDLGVRMGLHTGLVLVGSIGDQMHLTPTAIDGTLERATLCQQHAAPGAILVTGMTRRLVQEVVRLESWETLPGPQSGDNMEVYRIVARRRRRIPLGQVVELPSVPFVGRKRELDILHALLSQAEEGQGQVVGIVGEPGMGKSCLLREFCQQLDKDRLLYLEGQCLSYVRTRPILP